MIKLTKVKLTKVKLTKVKLTKIRLAKNRKALIGLILALLLASSGAVFAAESNTTTKANVTPLGGQTTTTATIATTEEPLESAKKFGIDKSALERFTKNFTEANKKKSFDDMSTLLLFGPSASERLKSAFTAGLRLSLGNEIDHFGLKAPSNQGIRVIDGVNCPPVIAVKTVLVVHFKNAGSGELPLGESNGKLLVAMPAPPSAAENNKWLDLKDQAHSVSCKMLAPWTGANEVSGPMATKLYFYPGVLSEAQYPRLILRLCCFEPVKGSSEHPSITIKEMEKSLAELPGKGQKPTDATVAKFQAKEMIFSATKPGDSAESDSLNGTIRSFWSGDVLVQMIAIFEGAPDKAVSDKFFQSFSIDNPKP